MIDHTFLKIKIQNILEWDLGRLATNAYQTTAYLAFAFCGTVAGTHEVMKI